MHQPSCFSTALRRIVMLFLLFLVPLSFSGALLTACGQCSHDSDCPAAELCLEGRCVAKEKDSGPTGECRPNETRQCYDGPAGTSGKGVCTTGTQSCYGGVWTECQGQVLPQEEKCDALDNDCDSEVDEGCPCTKNNQKKPCYTGPSETRNKGECKDGVQICIDGNWSPSCYNEKKPQPEQCDNKDNDCNGLVDDNLSRSCQTKCGPGKEICVAGAWQPCSAPQPVKEVCGDGKDNDCDGHIDEGEDGCTCNPNEKRECYGGLPGTAGKGPCQKGTQVCKPDGKGWGDCNGQVTPKSEDCNNKDDDCNGKIDDLTRPCRRGCNQGKEVCFRGKWQPCDAPPADAEICDGKDNDCNGKVDDVPGQKCSCRIGQTESCYTGPKNTSGKGLCKVGQRICQSTGKWSHCLGEITPVNESCDGKDNDCDGQTDEKLKRPCYNGPSGTADVGQCKSGSQLCSGGSWGSCVGEVHPKQESCDGKDNNCDGQIDEKLSRICYTGPSGTAGVGLCKKGKQTCKAGVWSSCLGQITPKLELCNQKDDDCDNKTDEDRVCEQCILHSTKACYTGPSNTRNIGPCKDGTSKCIKTQHGTEWGLCQGEVKPKTESCNNADDDCNGKTDDGLTRPCRNNCGSGTETCSAGRWVNCNAPQPQTEVCNNKDDDCDGKIDNLASGDKCTILATGDWNGKVIVWNPYSRKKLHSMTHPSRVNFLAFSPDKQTLGVAYYGGIALWNPETGIKKKIFTASGYMHTVAFSHDSKTVAGGGSANNVYLWNISTGSRKTLSGHSNDVESVTFSPNGGYLASGDDGGSVRIWRLSSSSTIKTFSPGGSIYCLAYSPDGKKLAIGTSAGKAYIYSTSSWSRLHTLSVSIVAYHVSFSFDNKYVTTASPNYAKVWDATSGSLYANIFFSGSWWVYAAALTPDNKILATGSRTNGRTGYLDLWDLSNPSQPKKIFTSTDHANYLWTLAFRP